MSVAEDIDSSRYSSKALEEANRLMIVCNSCRYCEGLCAVFPAMELRRAFAEGDLNYLANLCHNCGACYDACQFSPPHAFHVNVPQALAVVRNESYAAYAWPRMLSGVFERNGLAISALAAVSVTAFLLIVIAFQDPSVVWARHAGPGAFYKLVPHDTMALIFGCVFGYALLAIAMGALRFWRDIGEPAATLTEPVSLWQAMKDAGQLRYLDGGKGGCATVVEPVADTRRFYHHLTFYGFILCFLATLVATLYHYLLNREAPYPWYDLPVVLGTLGGIGIVVGPIGLLANKLRRPATLGDSGRTGMDVAFLVMLALTGMTGLALLFVRGTPFMNLLLAVHLGVVFALFASMPYSKFVHGFYRYLALVRFAREARTHQPSGND